MQVDVTMIPNVTTLTIHDGHPMESYPIIIPSQFNAATRLKLKVTVKKLGGKPAEWEEGGKQTSADVRSAKRQMMRKESPRIKDFIVKWKGTF